MPLKVPPGTFLSLCFLSIMRWVVSDPCSCHHDVLPHHEPRIGRVKDCGLKPLKPSANINHSSPLNCFVTVMGSLTNPMAIQAKEQLRFPEVRSEAKNRPFLHRRKQPCWHPDVRLPASRVVRWYTSLLCRLKKLMCIVILSLAFQGTAKLFSSVAAIPTNNVWGLQFLHILIEISFSFFQSYNFVIVLVDIQWYLIVFFCLLFFSWWYWGLNSGHCAC
jgi:hypothetical protein